LNNFASRPVVVGDFPMPATLAASAYLSPNTSYAGDNVNFYGHVQYVGITDPNTDVSGAEVKMNIIETGQIFTGYTKSNGDFSINFPAPSIIRTYTIYADVTDFTLSGRTNNVVLSVINRPVIVPPNKPICPECCDICPPPWIPPPPPPPCPGCPPSPPSPQGPDLAVYPWDIDWGTYCLSVGDPLDNVKVTFRNIGNKNADNFYVDYYFGESLLQHKLYSSVVAGQSITETISIGICVAGGLHSFRVVLDPSNTIAELDESNNVATSNIYAYPAGPDLSPTDIYFSKYNPYEGEPINLQFRLDNLNCETSCSTTATMTDTYNGIPTIIGTFIIPPVFGLDYMILPVLPLSHQFTGAGKHTITINVNPCQNESNKNNQSFSKDINIPERYADIVITDIYYTGTEYRATVQNIGNDIAWSFNVNFYIDGVGLGSAPVVILLPGGVTTVSSRPWNQDNICHTVCAKADEANVVTELNKINNNLCKKFGVDISVDLRSPYDRDNHISIPIGTDFDFSLYFYIINTGTVDAIDFPISYKINNDWQNYGTMTIYSGDNYYYGPMINHLFDESGDYIITFYGDIDKDNQMKYQYECNPNDNTAILYVHVYPHLPDLSVLSYQINPSKLNPALNEPIDLITSFDNLGTASSGSFNVSFYVDGARIGNPVPVADLGPGGTWSVMATNKYSDNIPGAKKILIKLDEDNQVIEATKSNNEASRAIILGWAPDLTFDSAASVSKTGMDISIDPPVIGNFVYLRAYVKNQGTVAATAYLNLYLENNNGNILLNSTPISLRAGETKLYPVLWRATVKKGKILGTITNCIPDEYNTLNNTTEFEFGKFTIPAISTMPVMDIRATTGIGGGNVTSDGGSTITARGICWSTSAIPTIANTHTTVTGTTGTFSSTMTGLSNSTIYHVRAYAANSVGTAYGDEITFMTAPNQITNLLVRSVSRVFIAIDWTRGNGTGCLAVCLKGTTSNLINPEYGTTNYTASNTFGSGSRIGSATPENYVVFKGTGNTIRVDGLTKNTQYTFKVYEYNLYNSYYSYATNSNSSNPVSRSTSPKEGYDPEWADSPDCRLLSVRINPIPANEVLNLALTLEESANITVELYNIDGQKVLVPINNLSYQKGQFEIPISITQFATGSYYLVVSGNNELVMQDFMIVH